MQREGGGREGDSDRRGALCQESAEVVMAANISSKTAKIGDDNFCEIFFSGLFKLRLGSASDCCPSFHRKN